jgi:protein phosphatase
MVYIAHVGDSAVYLLNDNGMEKLTTDHTRAQQLLNMGEITSSEAAIHPQRHWLTRAVGAENSINPDFLTANLEKGEALLLCSDGLTNEVELSEIRRILWEALSRGAVQEGAEALVEEAKRLGGADNITVVVVQRV